MLDFMLRSHRLAIWSAMSLASVLVVGSALAEDDLPPEARALATLKPWDVKKEKEPNASLNHFTAPWDRVLKQLADDTGSTLVMHDVPPGRFSRRDWKKHTRREAVKILNRELELIGFRILEKDQFLTVIQIRRTRREYQRPVRETAPVAASATPVPSQTPAPGESHSPAPVPMNQARPIQDAAVRPASTSESAGWVRPAAAEEPAAAPPAPAIESATVPVKNRPAIDVARQIHQAFGERSELIQKGPNGLPAFAVRRLPPVGGAPVDATHGPLFTVEIDAGQLIVTAPEAARHGVQGLIRQLDVSPLADEPPPTLVSGTPQTTAVAEQLKRPLAEITQNRRVPEGDPASTPTQRSERPIALAQNDGTQGPHQGQEEVSPMPNTQPSGAGDGQSGTTDLPALIGNLRGDVTLEALDDLDLLILRGNEGDVESVMQVIRAVEQLAVGSLPEIHLLKLQHVDSESLATLLTDVYTRMSELRSRNAQQQLASVAVIPVVTPNAVLILAPGNAMESVLSLASELDQPVDPSHQVQVFHLESAVAADVAEMLGTFYEEQVGLGTRLRIAIDERTNSVVVQARPRDLSEVEALIRKIDRDDAKSVSKVRIFQLKTALAEELAEFLTAAINSVADPRASTVATSGTGIGTGTTTTTQSEPKSVVLEFLAEDGAALARSGLLQDIRFNADPRTNSLMVTAPERSLALVAELIRVLDRPSENVAEIKVFELRKADAADAVTLLQELFDSSQTGTQQQGTSQPLGVQLAGTRDGSHLVPMRFSVDSRTNSVVAIGGADGLRVVEAILRRLDANEARDREATVVKLRNSPAADVAEAINQFLQSQRELAQLDPDRISTSELLEQEVIVTAEPITNSLLISATPAYFERIRSLAEKLDAEPSQVVIQALLVEVTLDNTDEFGVELGFQDSILFDRSVIEELLTISETTTSPNGVQTTTQRIISQSSTPGFAFNNQPLGNNTSVAPSTVGSQGLSNFSLGRLNGDLGFGGLVLSASSDSVNVLIRALASRRQVRVLSRPQVLALDNQLAQIQVGQVVPVPDGVSIVNNSVVPIVTRDPAGIILTVTPRISPEGQVVMEVVAEKSIYTSDGVTIFTDVTTGTEITSPIKDITTARTTVKVPDGQTIVVGGMITKSDEKIERKVPWLGDVPILGTAFRYDARSSVRTELLIFLTPRIIHHDGDSEVIKQVEADRLHWFEDEAEAIHGPIFGVPAEMTVPAYEGMPLDMTPAPILPGATQPTPSGTPVVPPAPQVSPVPPMSNGTTDGKGVSTLESVPTTNNE